MLYCYPHHLSPLTFFFFNDTATTEIYTLSLHDALPISYTNWWAFYLQDSWRPTSTLTVDYGVRYDLRPPMKDRTNQLGNFDRNTGSVVVPNQDALNLVPASVRASLPHTPFVLAKDIGLPEA